MLRSPECRLDRAVLTFVLAISTATFCVRLVYGSDRSFYNMHLADFSQYTLLFGAGIMAVYRRGWLDRISTVFGIRWLTFSLVVGGALWTMLLAIWWRAATWFRGTAAASTGKAQL